MFNKSSLFNRNDPVTRREVAPPVLGSGTKPGQQTANNGSRLTPAPATVIAPVQTVAVANPAETPSVVKPVQEAASPSVASENVMGARLIVGPDVKLKGAEILDCDTLVVEGRVEATMDSRVIRIAENGSFAGKVSIDIAEIHGTFEGELTARSQLIIHSTGRVTGTIRYGKLVADEGCELCGDISSLSTSKSVKLTQGSSQRAEFAEERGDAILALAVAAS